MTPDKGGLNWYSRIPMSYFIDKQGKEHVLRFGSIKDFFGLLEMYRRFEPKESIMGVPPDNPVKLKKWVEHFFSEDIKNIVIMDPDRKIIGHAAIFPIDSECCEYFMALLPSDQSAGIGRLLCESVIETACYMDLKRVWICVEKGNAKALHLHKKIGYRVVGGGMGDDFELEIDVSNLRESPA